MHPSQPIVCLPFHPRLHMDLFHHNSNDFFFVPNYINIRTLSKFSTLAVGGIELLYNQINKEFNVKVNDAYEISFRTKKIQTDSNE